MEWEGSIYGSIPCHPVRFRSIPSSCLLSPSLCHYIASLRFSYLEGIPAITPIGEDVNPANWMLDEVGGGANPNPEKQQQIVEHFSSSEPCKALQADLDANSSPTAEAIKFEKRYAAPWTKQFHQLYYRAGRVYRRSPEYSVIRTLVMFVFAVIFGTAYWDMGWNIETDFWLRLAFIYTTTFYCGLTFLISGVSVLMGQRCVCGIAIFAGQWRG